jgi:peptidoglycan-N-acetylglucosamine deacetylase
VTANTGERIRELVKAGVPRSLVIRRLRPSAGRSVLLTFDDGPHPDVTPAVLQRLSGYGARAVFFLIGRRIKRAPHVVDLIVRGGHRVGNHSHLHRANYILTGAHQPGVCKYYKDVRRCQEVIERCTGFRPDLFRPPGGRLTPSTVLVPKLLGLDCVTWSKEVKDWGFRAASQAREGGRKLADSVEAGDIVLLHDNNPFVLELLDQLLPALQDRQMNVGLGVEHV